MNRLKTLAFWKQVFLGLVVVALLVGISFFLTLRKGENTQAAADAVKAGAPVSSYYSPDYNNTSATVIPAGMEQLVTDLIDLNLAFMKYRDAVYPRDEKQMDKASAESKTEITMAYEELTPYMDPLSNVRKLKGEDGFGGKWGPFVIIKGKDTWGEFAAAQEIFPCDATRAKFSGKVAPEYWASIERYGRLHLIQP